MCLCTGRIQTVCHVGNITSYTAIEKQWNGTLEKNIVKLHAVPLHTGMKHIRPTFSIQCCQGTSIGIAAKGSWVQGSAPTGLGSTTFLWVQTEQIIYHNKI